MTFLDLIEVLKSKEATLELAEREAPFADEYDTVLVYIKDEMTIRSEVKFVDAEAEIRSNFAEINIGGSYCQMGLLSTLQETVEEYVAVLPDWDNARIARRMMEYRINDA